MFYKKYLLIIIIDVLENSNLFFLNSFGLELNCKSYKIMHHFGTEGIYNMV